MNITYSSELMRNYKQSNVISPQKKFKAVQTDSGNALLFSIGTDNTFYLIEQSSGSDVTGWQEIDLSSDLASKISPKGKAKDFSVAQNLSTGKIDLVLVITVDSKDTLYVSLGHSNEKGSITSDILWSEMTYDDPDHPDILFDIEDVFISNSSDKEYIVADILESSSLYLKRYYIDPNKTTGTFWNPMVTGGNLERGVQTRLGRKSGEEVDGTYTLGKIGDSDELLYAPLYNPFDRNTAPTPTRLQMPENASALNVADAGDGTTDLFVAAGNELYYFAAGKQQDNAKGQKVVSNALFQDVVELHVYKSSTQYIVWGLNRANQVFYTSSDIADVLDSSKWSLPLPILIGVNNISPYANKADDAHTIFSASNNEVNISVCSPATTIWNTQAIRLPGPPQSKANSFSSYTTRVQLDDGENNPLAKTEVLISANSPVPVYINHLYYLLNKTPIPVSSDILGSLTIIEAVDGLDSVQLTIAHKDGTSVTINPMEKPFEKITSLDTKENLKSAVIKYPDGTTKPLVSSEVSDPDLEWVAQVNKNLKNAYTSIKTSGNRRKTAAMAITLKSESGDVIEAIETDVGNLFMWLESGIEHKIQLIKNAETDLWHLIVKVGNEIYQGVLDCEEKIVGAVRWVYNAIKVIIEDLIKYLEFLFEWDDIKRTKEVIKNLLMKYLRHEADQIVGQIEHLKDTFNKEIDNLIKKIDRLACIQDWSGLGDAATQTLNASSTPNRYSSAPEDMLSYHLINNVNNITQFNPPETLAPNDSPIKTLREALKKEGKVLDDFFDGLYKLISNYSTHNLGYILTRLIEIISESVLKSAQVVINALLDILSNFVNAGLEILDTEIHIPVVSDILEEIGVGSVSFIDLFCWIAAVPFTISYKISKHCAPFSDDETTNFLKNANTTWKEIVQAFTGSSLKQGGAAMLKASAVNDAAEAQEDSINYSVSDDTQELIFLLGHMLSGMFGISYSFISGLEALSVDTVDKNLSTAMAICSGGMSGFKGIANVLAPKNPINNKTVKWVNTTTTLIMLLSKLIFCESAQEKFDTDWEKFNFLKMENTRAISAIIDCILTVPLVICSIWHFHELNQEDDSPSRTAAKIEEMSNFCSYFSRFCYAVAVNFKDPYTKGISIGIMTDLNIATIGLQFYESVKGLRCFPIVA